MIKITIPLVPLALLLVVECGGVVEEPPQKHYTLIPQPPIVCEVGSPCPCNLGGPCDGGADATDD